MSWRFSRALVEAYSGASSSGGEPSAPLKSNTSAKKTLGPVKMTDAWSRSQSGIMSKPSTETLGEELLTRFRSDFHAKTLVLETPLQSEFRAQEAVCGNMGPASFAKFDHRACSWRIRQLWLFEDLESSLATWPQWGMMRDGECWELETPAGCTNAIESGLLHIPTIGKNEMRSSSRKRWRGSKDFRGAKMSEGLRTCYSDPTYTHPSFAELIMGFPTRWTELQPSETPNIPRWLNSHTKP